MNECHFSRTDPFKNYSPSGGKAIEFVFDPVSQRFVVGAAKAGLPPLVSPHEALASSIGADTSKVVGGMLKRGPSGDIMTNEHSGHYNQNWNPEVRANFIVFLESMTGIKVEHTEGSTW